MNRNGVALFREIFTARTLQVAEIVSSKKFIKATFILFLLQSLFYALTIKYGIPPDEQYHFKVAELFVQNNFSPFISSQEGLFSLGELTRTPYLMYHYLLSFPLALLGNLSLSAKILILRGINILLAASSLLVLQKIAEKLKFSSFTANVSIFIFANSMMYTFLAGSINYDNLFILLVFTSILLLIRFLQEKKPADLMLWSIVILLGAFTKEAFLPVVLAETVALVVMLRLTVISTFVDWLKSFNKALVMNIVLAVGLIALFSMFIRFFVGNQLAYGDISPRCEIVHSYDECLDHGLFRRSIELKANRPNDFEADTSKFVYGWAQLMRSRTFGTLSHASVEPSRPLIAATSILFVLMLIAVIRKVEIKKINKPQLIVLFVVAFYVLSLMYVNYGSYVRNGRFMAVQGRYIFPALPIIYFFGFHYMEKLKFGRTLRAVAIVALLPLIIMGNIPTYIINSTEFHYSGVGLDLYRLFR
ncbi:MAG: DUF2142 domain-containing protein [Candidatus Saccharimonadales bacterium]